jgi:hypothetical protein
MPEKPVDFFAKQRQRYIKNAQLFQMIFGVPLKNYWNIAGFDVIKFDETLIKPEEGQSTAEAVRQKYGEEALKLCKDLVAAS